ncbi:MAG: hypothetical protein IPG01_13105 [Chitinophagaceae bacterium]|nr:hypothetical protein [Chitinophagaceae bacterium]
MAHYKMVIGGAGAYPFAVSGSSGLMPRSYNLIVDCSIEKETLSTLRAKVESTFEEKLHSKVFFFDPASFFEYLDKEIAKEASTEIRMKGYRVKMEYNSTVTIP